MMFQADNDDRVEVFRDSGERGGCYSFANREVTECKDCELQKACPADGEE